MGDPCDLAPMWESLNRCLNEDPDHAPALLGHPGDPPDRGILGEKRVRRSEGDERVKSKGRSEKRGSQEEGTKKNQRFGPE